MIWILSLVSLFKLLLWWSQVFVWIMFFIWKVYSLSKFITHLHIFCIYWSYHSITCSSILKFRWFCFTLLEITWILFLLWITLDIETISFIEAISHISILSYVILEIFSFLFILPLPIVLFFPPIISRLVVIINVFLRLINLVKYLIFQLIILVLVARNWSPLTSNN